ncbi:Arylsulfatase A [Flaviramulus basaltis]|uniref:Arylsulfatase A n=1 Tax=Flaviramulus basaltis TaxID=369401 RepID=A0A1K2IMJ9_9FLAO|nr:sulfatase-like hydrolase/transferase [Flaviramulus basaltis]SFZ93599.1 Arylsulfatase A [Flaviramulus basaltis]
MILKRFFYLILATLICSCSERKLETPNILWITSEDNSPLLGCYGDTFATTPNLDNLATKGFLYTHAYANAPVCAPARNTIITGVYANSGGNQYMRSFYNKSSNVKLYPEILKKKGYYLTNNEKEDFNINKNQTQNLWDELGETATYKNRPKGKPFFSIFNIMVSHESSLHTYIPNEELRHKPEDITLPPYHPDTPEMRHDWAQYYDKVEDMDTQVGQILSELQKSGEAENTIIMYYGDHGGVLARSKRYVYETGTRVPFIVYIPEKYKKLYPKEQTGTKEERLISFVDLAPTLLSILNVPIPDFMQGSAFLGEQKTEDPKYAYMFRDRMDERFDMSRAVRDKKFRYIKNYMPYRIYGQHIDYLWRAPSIGSWEDAYNKGECNAIQSAFWEKKPTEELYDTEKDPWEVNNLALNPNYFEVLKRMRQANKQWMLDIKDTGLIPEGILSNLTKDIAAYDYMRNENVNIENIIDAANFATSATKNDLEPLIELLSSQNESIRYWGATGILILGNDANKALNALKLASKDGSGDVAAVAIEALYGLGAKNDARKELIRVIQDPNEMVRTHALNVVDVVNENTPEIKSIVVNLLKSGKDISSKERYDLRCANFLVSKWGLNI